MVRWLAAAALASLLWLPGHPALAGQSERTLCFFSLNNALEFELTSDFLEQAVP